MMASVWASIMAAVNPCRNRAPTSSVGLCAIPHSTEATVNAVNAKRNTLRRPKRSPRRAAVISVQAKARV